MTALYVDNHVYPVREEVFRVADGVRLPVHIVSNGFHPFRPVVRSNVQLAIVPVTPVDWDAEHVTVANVYVTADIPSAPRCVEKRTHIQAGIVASPQPHCPMACSPDSPATGLRPPSVVC